MVTPAPPKRTIWPYAIIAAFVLFASYIGFMVQQAMRTSVDLVSPDYYQQELAYQQRMESVARTAALPAPVVVTHEAAAHRLKLALPAGLSGQAIEGTLHFFRPSDQKLDFKLPFAPAGTPALQELNTSKLQPGLWRLRVDFTAGNQQYFLEKELSISE
ncbi:nitrogen fixation protein FixH [Hymenobacter lutimineralis]|uniref:Nitrogen fixation protein FixH n=1 Tax=Hymenobacter lutimineralis TaxID=2606448 RepID=A0A5D6UW71_9BACT|nr:FixH family protein [Hymenobacter lutimineralis]TYZ06912.1 nitrogen fixation protein FixH [Hymenobacter lutimineralis]